MDVCTCLPPILNCEVCNNIDDIDNLLVPDLEEIDDGVEIIAPPLKKARKGRTVGAINWTSQHHEFIYDLMYSDSAFIDAFNSAEGSRDFKKLSTRINEEYKTLLMLQPYLKSKEVMH